MIKGIDISSWQGNLKPSHYKSQIDFAIIKATEGNDYLNPHFLSAIKDCINADMLFGFYHYYNPTCSAKENARWFWNKVHAFTTKGIPVLDYEEWQGNDAKLCEIFIDEYYKYSHVYPVLYISASHCTDFGTSGIPKKCPLWVAGYPRDYATWPKLSMCPYDVNPWKNVVIWQFASDWRLVGCNQDLDANVSNLSRKEWLKIARGETGKPVNDLPETMPDCMTLAHEVLAGKWGNGLDRVERLSAAYGGDTYTHVQAIVNEMIENGNV